MKTIKKEPIEHEADKIESIKAKIEELDDYKMELESFYNKLKLELGKKDLSTTAKK